MKKIYVTFAIILSMLFTACDNDEAEKQVCVPMNEGVNVTISVLQPNITNASVPTGRTIARR